MRRSKQNGFDFGVQIGTGGGPVGNNKHASAGLQGQLDEQRRAQKRQDFTPAVQRAQATGTLHLANKGLVSLPLELIFPSDVDDVDPDDLSPTRGGIAAKIGQATPPPSAQQQHQQQAPPSLGNPNVFRVGSVGGGRKRVGPRVDLDFDSKSGLRTWEWHPIQQLDCSANSLTTLVDDDDGAQRFSRLGDTLKLLQCSRNSLTALPTLAGFSSLANLDISRNQLGGDLCQALRGGGSGGDGGGAGAPLLPSLGELDASQNQFTSVTLLLEAIAPNLRVLRLSKNKLGKFSFASSSPSSSSIVVSSLREIDVSYNNLDVPVVAHSSSAVAHPVLETLDISFNSFALTYPNLVLGEPPQPPQPQQQQQQQHPAWRQHLSNLRAVSLRHCGATSLSIFGCPQLRDINASENQLLEFPALDLASRAALNAIDCSNNKLTSLGPLVNAPSLSSAYEQVSAHDVSHLFPVLERCDVSNNNISVIPPRLCLLPALRNFALLGNPIRSVRRELLAKNTQELKAYLRSRLQGEDELANDEAAANTSKSAKLQMAMEAAAPEPAQPQLAHPQQAQSQQQYESVSVKRGGGGDLPQQKAISSQPIGNRQGALWDLSRAVNRGGRSGVTTGRGLQLAKAAIAGGGGGGGGASSGSGNDDIPLLPELVTADTILAVSPHTQALVGECKQLSLQGQSRLRELSVDFFAALVPQLTDLDVSRCASLASLESVLGDPQGPVALKTVVASHCSLAGCWPVQWCRPSPPERQCLVHLDISNNALTSLCDEFALAVCWSLRHLNISGNRITEFPPTLQHLRLLTELIYSRNGLVDSSLPVDDGGLATFFPELTTLDLSYNELRSVARLPQALGGFAPAQLRALRLEGNGCRFLGAKLIEGPSQQLIAALKERM